MTMANPRNDRRRPTRVRRVTVRFDETEVTRLTRFASGRAINVSALMRAAVLDVVGGHTAGPTIAPAVEEPQAASRDLVALRVAVNRVGVNVNQLARLGNRHGFVVLTGEDDHATCTQVLAQTKAVLDEVRDALGGSARP